MERERELSLEEANLLAQSMKKAKAMDMEVEGNSDEVMKEIVCKEGAAREA